MRKLYPALMLIVVAWSQAVAQSDLTLHVGLTGNDAWSGTLAKPAASDGPLRTLAAAQKAARAALVSLRANGAGTVRVLIQPGLYELNEALVFGPEDSGVPGRPMVYQAVEPGTVTLSGGRRLQAIPSVSPNTEALFAAPSIEPALWAGGPQLYVNGQRAVLAREPNKGSHWFAGQPVAVPAEASDPPGHEAFKASPPALAFLHGLSPADRNRALLHVMQSWSSGRHRLAAAAPEGTVRVSPRSRWPFLFFGTSQRYYVENVAAALDQGGEWIGSPAGVRYLLRANERPPVNATLPMLDQLVVVRGAGLAGPYVQHLELRDLSFKFTRALTPPAGWVDTQAALEIGAAIQVDFARNFTLKGCEISAIGGYGVWLREGVRDSQVLGCALADLGAGGVKVGMAAQASVQAIGTGANSVSGNHIQQTGRQFPGAVGVWVGQSFDNDISHNTIEDTTYTAISVGWEWGYAAVTSGRNRIVDNALLNIGGGAMADLGGIYTLGPSPGTLIAGNLIREVRGYHEHGAGAWGIYNDEGSSDLRIENNVVIGTDSGAYHLNSGRNLTVQNNLFAQGDEGEARVSRSDPGRTRLLLRDNLIITAATSPFTEYAKPRDVEFVGNLVAPSRPSVRPNLQACANGCAPSDAALTLGPGPQQLKVTGIAASAAQGWADIAASAGAVKFTTIAGAIRAKTTAAAAKGASAVAPARADVDRPAPPLAVTLDLDSVASHTRPAGWRYMPSNRTSAIEVVTSERSPGGRCLKFNDGPSFANRYEPYIFTRLNHDHGSSSASFAVQIDETSEFIHEWRDDASPYLIGPSVRITSQGVEAGGKVVAPALPGSWLSLRLTAQLGEASTWELQVTDAYGKVYTAVDLPPKNVGWKSLRWLGLISNAAVTSVTCLANFSVKNNGQ